MKFRHVEHKETHHDRLVMDAKQAIDFVFTDLAPSAEKTKESLEYLSGYIIDLKNSLTL